MEDSTLLDAQPWRLRGNRLLIRDLCLEVKLGVSAAERARKQRLLITLEVETVPARAAENEIASVVDYGRLVAAIEALAERETQLLETWASWIADLCFGDGRILSASITLIKPDIYDGSTQVGIRQDVTRAE